MNHPVVWFEVTGQDADKLRGFYGELFGWKMQKHPEMDYSFVDASEAGIGGGIGKAEQGPGQVTFYVASADPQASLDRANRLGGRTIMPVTELPQVTLALFADPEGHVIGLVKEQDEAAAG